MHFTGIYLTMGSPLLVKPNPSLLTIAIANFTQRKMKNSRNSSLTQKGKRKLLPEGRDKTKKCLIAELNRGSSHELSTVKRATSGTSATHYHCANQANNFSVFDPKNRYFAFYECSPLSDDFLSMHHVVG